MLASIIDLVLVIVTGTNWTTPIALLAPPLYAAYLTGKRSVTITSLADTPVPNAVFLGLCATGITIFLAISIFVTVAYLVGTTETSETRHLSSAEWIAGATFMLTIFAFLIFWLINWSLIRLGLSQGKPKN